MERHKDIRVTGLDSSVATVAPEGGEVKANGFAWRQPQDVPGWADLFLPPAGSKEEDERFYERMYLLEQLDNIIRALYQLFLTERMGSDWHTQHLPRMQAWINAQGEYSNVENRPPRTEDPITPPKSTPQTKAYEDELSADLTSLNPGAEASLNESSIPPWENPIMGEND